MKLTKHARKRMSQRGISHLGLNIIEYFGTYRKAPGGAVRISFGNKEHQVATSELKQIQQWFDSLKGSDIIIDENRHIAITAYKQN